LLLSFSYLSPSFLSLYIFLGGSVVGAVLQQMWFGFAAV
jgi:hypothetical protein